MYAPSQALKINYQLGTPYFYVAQIDANYVRSLPAILKLTPIYIFPIFWLILAWLKLVPPHIFTLFFCSDKINSAS